MTETYSDGLDHACFAVERDAAEQLARDAFWAVKLNVDPVDLARRLGFAPDNPPLRAV